MAARENKAARKRMTSESEPAIAGKMKCLRMIFSLSGIGAVVLAEGGQYLYSAEDKRKINLRGQGNVRLEWCLVRGEFTPRGGLTTSVFAHWPAIDTQYKKNKEGRGQKGRARLIRKK